MRVPTYKELMQYARRVKKSLGALGVTIMIRTDDDIMVVTTEDEGRHLRRIHTRMDVIAGRQEAIEEAQSILNPDKDNE